MNENEVDNNDEGPGIFPPVCSRCRRLSSWTELLEIDPEVQAKIVDGKFVCADCLEESERI